MTVEPTTKDKQITIDVPEDRVAEFYAFYGRFLAGFPGRRRRGHRPHHHGCRSGGERSATATSEPAEPTRSEPARPETTNL